MTGLMKVKLGMHESAHLCGLRLWAIMHIYNHNITLLLPKVRAISSNSTCADVSHSGCMIKRVHVSFVLCIDILFSTQSFLRFNFTFITEANE